MNGGSSELQRLSYRFFVLAFLSKFPYLVTLVSAKSFTFLTLPFFAAGMDSSTPLLSALDLSGEVAKVVVEGRNVLLAAPKQVVQTVGGGIADLLANSKGLPVYFVPGPEAYPIFPNKPDGPLTGPAGSAAFYALLIGSFLKPGGKLSAVFYKKATFLQ